ncbi:MAG: 4-hydroxythreonine-4-phosphate dehydrogenase PdxA, partial [Candidatus Poribacteria bacterium]
GPIHKEALNLAGFHYAGHTEIYSELTKTKDYVMMLVDDNFRIAHVSTHVSLKKACEMVKKDRIVKVINLTYDMLGCLDIENPKIAVAGLNPHAGEGGLFGDEEKEIKAAIDSVRQDGINAQGPFPPDTIFSRAKGGEFDAVVAMYHDQGHIALKTTGFVYEGNGRWSSISGVNVTLGLPIIRTSVDHGVAFDKAGDGIANPQSMEQAIKLAVKLCKCREFR